jgi:hypothetical protein
MSFLNPGREIRETIMFRHARTHRTTFGQKARDAFFVFYGSFGVINQDSKMKSSAGKSKLHFGLFDYFTFGVPYGLSILSALLMIVPRSLPLKIAGAILSAAFAIPRAIFASVLTFVSLPIIGIVQAVASGKGEQLKYMIHQHKLTGADKKTTSVGHLFKSLGVSIEGVERVEKTITREQGKPLGKMTLTFIQGANKASIEMPVDKKDELVNKAESKFFKTLRKLNLGDLQYQQEVEAACAVAKL